MRVADAAPLGVHWGTADLLSDPRVLVVAQTDDRIGALCRGLDGLGWRTMTARTGGAAVAALGDFKLEAAIIDADHPEAAALPEALRLAAGARRL
ncbi:hypothetical protein IP78_13100, partial [Brevundimonas sp. AAP58]